MHPDILTDLHDRLSRGEPLSAEEQQALHTWYAEQDQRESQELQQQQSSDDLAQLHQQIAQTAQHLESLTQQITATLQTNSALRQEIARLQARLAQLTPGRAA